jgi:hypothetical protein
VVENKHLNDVINQKNKEIQEMKQLISGESKEQDLIKQKNQ